MACNVSCFFHIVALLFAAVVLRHLQVHIHDG